jgi:hypothetical protein
MGESQRVPIPNLHEKQISCCRSRYTQNGGYTVKKGHEGMGKSEVRTSRYISKLSSAPSGPSSEP